MSLKDTLLTAERKCSCRSTCSFLFCTLPFCVGPEEMCPERTRSYRYDANVALVSVRQQQSEKVNATGPEYLFPQFWGWQNPAESFI